MQIELYSLALEHMNMKYGVFLAENSESFVIKPFNIFVGGSTSCGSTIPVGLEQNVQKSGEVGAAPTPVGQLIPSSWCKEQLKMIPPASCRPKAILDFCKSDGGASPSRFL